MRTLVLTALATLALLATVAPPAAASHMGPCTHEYAEAAIYGVQHYKTGGLGVAVNVIVYCLTHPAPGVEDTLAELLYLP